MEADKNIEQMIKNPLFMLGAFGHLRVLLLEAGLGFGNGLILLSTGQDIMSIPEKTLIALGIQKVQIRTGRLPSMKNYQTGVVEYGNYCSEKALSEYLYAQNFLPTVIVRGVLPDTLKSFRNVILFCVDTPEKELQSMFQKFCKYSHDNTEQVQFVIEESKEYIYKYPELSDISLSRALFAVGMVILQFFMERGSILSYKESWIENIVSTILEMCQLIDVDEIKVASMVAQTVDNFLDTHKDVIVEDIENVHGAVSLAMEESRVILYDLHFYYFPEELFRKIMEGSARSVPSIKNALLQEGALVCNCSTDNYTVKKEFYNSYGVKMRRRFLKIRREVLDCGCRLFIAERGRLDDVCRICEW